MSLSQLNDSPSSSKAYSGMQANALTVREKRGIQKRERYTARTESNNNSYVLVDVCGGKLYNADMDKQERSLENYRQYL